jgi:hypothetical protein
LPRYARFKVSGHHSAPKTQKCAEVHTLLKKGTTFF